MGALAARRAAASARAVAAALAVALLAGLAAWMLATRPPATTAEERAAQRAAFVAATGVRPIRVALTGGGGLIDLRYQVVDADKALAVHDPKRPPALIEDGSTARIDRPWMGHGHSGAFRTGGVYFILLINSRGQLERGANVTLDMAGERLAGLKVQ
jgi:hypothetical protein